MNIANFILFFLTTVSCQTYEDKVEGRLASSQQGLYSVKTLTYSKVKRKNLQGDLYLPARGQKFPVVLMIHGGGWARGNRQQMTPVAEKFAREGFAVFNISYRFAPEHTWPSQREDVEDALRFIAQIAAKKSLDLNNIATYGYSAGAHLALLLAYHSDRSKPGATRIKAVAGGGSPVDLTAWPEGELVVKFIGHPYSTHSHLYREASPVNYVTDQSPPTFLYHGYNDWIVEVEQSYQLVRKLNEVGVEVQFYEPFFGHVNTFLFDDHETDLVIQFFRRHLL